MNSADRLLARLHKFRDDDDWEASLMTLASVDFSQYDGKDLHLILNEFFDALLETNNFSRCCKLLEHYGRTYIDDLTIKKSDLLLNYLRNDRVVIATFDVKRKPANNEIVFCYGDYPHILENLACFNPVRRHLKYFWDVQHDVVEYDHVWDAVDAFYVINADERVDRFVETLRELRRMAVPFNKVHRFSAVVDKSTSDSYLNGTIGCAKSHLGVVQDSLKKGYRQILVLEDDFCFTENLDQHRDNLELFFKRNYDFHVCMLATSKYHKTAEFDELLKLSYQVCTTCSGYLVSFEGLRRLKDIWENALEKLIKSKNLNFACDRSWSKLQKQNKFFFFKQKLGFQRPSYSSITGETSFYMD